MHPEPVETEWPDAEPDQPQALDTEWEEAPESDVDATELPASAAEAAEALCPTCGELLAWHDEFSSCAATSAAPAIATLVINTEEEFSQELVETEPERPRLFGRVAPRGTFAYELGRLVQPAPASPAQIIWRGQLKERHPETGLIHRVNVYRLNDGYWDCYREEELQAA